MRGYSGRYTCQEVNKHRPVRACLVSFGLVVLTFLPYNVVRCEWSSGYALLHPCSSRNVERRRAWPPLGSHAFLLNTPQRTPLYVAAEEGRTSFVIELLRRGAEVNAPSVPLSPPPHTSRVAIALLIRLRAEGTIIHGLLLTRRIHSFISNLMTS